MVELGTANLDILVVVGTKTTLWSRECLVDCSTCKFLLLMLSSLSKNFLHSHHVLNNYAYWACLLDYPSTISMVMGKHQAKTEAGDCMKLKMNVLTDTAVSSMKRLPDS